MNWVDAGRLTPKACTSDLAQAVQLQHDEISVV
jgi:hypothetical protein